MPPECRRCDTNVLVDARVGRGVDWQCYGCGHAFDTPAVFAGQRGRGGRPR